MTDEPKAVAWAVADSLRDYECGAWYKGTEAFPDASAPLYDHDAILAAEARGRAEMRERCARVCDDFAENDLSADECADAIRALPLAPDAAMGEG